jgi:PTH2 family peptidyl-tRNA hydrolase
MPNGKLASQAGHAYLGAFIEAQKSHPSKIKEYLADSIGTKLCLSAKNEEHLIEIFNQAISAGLPASLIYDTGHIMPPHFTGEPILTAVGIGPSLRHEHHHITKKLSLVK